MLQTLTSKLSPLALCFAFGLILFSLTGCGEPPKDPTGTLIGKVKSDGELCGDCMISIADDTGFNRRGGVVDESGSFEIKEIPFGEYKVRVLRMPSNLAVNIEDERIPPKYSRLKTSGLSASITSEEPVTLDVDMK